MKPDVIVVDDDPSARFFSTLQLSKAGYDVEEADCLMEARECLSRKRFNALILDLGLPDGNGIDWIARFKKDYPAMAVIVVTGQQEPEVRNEAIRRGADGFFLKPVCAEDLLEFVRRTVLHDRSSSNEGE